MLKPILPAVLLSLALSAAASAKGTGYVFVSHEKTNNIAVIDPKQDYRIIKWIDTSHRPRDMNFRNDRQQLLVACGDDDVIDVIDVATLQVVDHIPTGPSPEMFEISRDQNSLYVSDEEASAVQEISIKDKMIDREIATGAEPEGVAVSSDGKTLYATSEVSDMVHVIDLAAGVVTDNIVVGTRPRRFLLLPNGKELWVSNELSGQVSIIDRATKQVTQTLDFLPPGFRQVDVTPVGMTMTKDGTFLAVKHHSLFHQGARSAATAVGRAPRHDARRSSGVRRYFRRGTQMRDVMKFRMLLVAAIVSLPAPRVAAAGDVAAGQEKAKVCAACHGENGVSSMPGIPSLAGQQDQFVQWQLVFFRSGRRPNPAMASLVGDLSDEDIRDLGAYFHSLP